MKYCLSKPILRLYGILPGMLTFFIITLCNGDENIKIEVANETNSASIQKKLQLGPSVSGDAIEADLKRKEVGIGEIVTLTATHEKDLGDISELKWTVGSGAEVLELPEEMEGTTTIRLTVKKA